MATKRTTKPYDDTTAAAREIIDAQDRAHDAKTARLRKARLDKEAADVALGTRRSRHFADRFPMRTGCSPDRKKRPLAPRSGLPYFKEMPHLRENERYGPGVKRPGIKSESQTPLVERAYELARTGAFSTTGEIRNHLKREGYGAASVQIHFQGRAIRDDLARICREAASGDRAEGGGRNEWNATG
jgi:hypothetical protein